MKNTLIILIFILIFASASAAQTSQNATCPTFDVSGGGVIEHGSPFTFTVNFKEDYDLSKLSFKWTVSGGKLFEGQGTTSIAVTDFRSSENVTATIEVKGLPEGCANTASETGSCSCDYVFPRLIDEFGNIPYEEVEARFDAFFIILREEPNAQAYIVNYGTNRQKSLRETHFRRRIAIRKFDASRFIFVRGGANPKGEPGAMTRIWIVPAGAVPPTP